jgi:hypothetical protein
MYLPNVSYGFIIDSVGCYVVQLPMTVIPVLVPSWSAVKTRVPDKQWP